MEDSTTKKDGTWSDELAENKYEELKELH